MLPIRAMSLDDLPLGMRLKEAVGWNQTEDDWRRLLALEPDGCFVAESDGQSVGTVCTTVLGSVGWISMVLVDKAMRGSGFGTRLLKHALGFLDRRGVATVRLDATPLGRPIYEGLGFQAEYGIARFEGVAIGGQASRDVVRATPERLAEIVALDQRATGIDRSRLIERLYQERSRAMHVMPDRGTTTGYFWIRHGSLARQIGPLVACNADAGRRLAEAALHLCHGLPVLLDIPAPNTAATQWAESHSFRLQRTLTRMRRGRHVADRPTELWAAFGPEKG